MNRTVERTVGILILLTLLCLVLVLVVYNPPIALAQPKPDPSAACLQTCAQDASLQPVVCQVYAPGAPVLATQTPVDKVIISVKGGDGKPEEDVPALVVTPAPNPPETIVTPPPAKEKEHDKGGDRDDDKKCRCDKGPGGHDKDNKDGKHHKDGDDHDKGKGHDKHKKDC